MPRNVEIKARIADIEQVACLAAALADHGPTEIFQDDTFFRCAKGRLKLREFAAGHGELIFYRRPGQAGPKASFYLRTATSEPAHLRAALALAYGVSGQVVKRRRLFLAGRTRIHPDQVQGLGSFLELEVVLEEDEPMDGGVREAESLMRRLGIDVAQCVEQAYVDLLAGDAR
ncbi:class IV adenylate cyclase [Comamonas endophytica]|uniref:Class IV adenylate cyclase n=1 Tax=Comamonas endophytica TaxID=2949090 RepID=A0ABY6GEZ5_9BURK|nr:MULTISPECIES: class IV adenylate cyclase [unclassified Acidovorax]MCD2514370.1 class IV adenylate cyclase [Acidovorax sp. D4N7]UYG53613.1 class IV adenylate cyclase [Acidovorax sp. 5MLIR]UYG53660.1 class IV adenylate cyclase [Acidovorax sp. 5MLIR]